MGKSSNNNPRPDDLRPDGAFFGRRKGPKLHRYQQGLVDEFLPTLIIDITQPSPNEIGELFPEQSLKQYHLEVGFGGGEHLLHQAKLNPDIGYIGVEPFLNGMGKALAGIKAENLKNIRIYDNDATPLLDWLPASSFERLYLLYPDPWPKKKHWKRRFVNQGNLDRIARILRSGGEFRFASDIDTYVNWTLNHCHSHRAFDWSGVQASNWHEPWANWIQTRYEAKAIREGRQPAYFRYSRQ
ncbi:MAG: tRNA (guanosine(46)-N7)-methyltransferase TrmB [Rhizobiaceae bacterium]|nr:tRNA (guanosine(46)-N7)-methyltransferase TrmB [Rhizobiaceae bacterium]